MQGDSGAHDESRYATASTALTHYSSLGKVSGGKQSDVDVKLCQHCNGMGLRVEEYNHRRLEVPACNGTA